MRKVLAVLTLVCAACGDDASGTRRDGGVVVTIDAPEFAPTLTSFVATPPQVPAGVATNVTWTWSFLQDPTFPDPTCSIDNGVGAVTKGQSIPITINAVTTFRLTCANSQGMAQREVIIGVPPVAPTLATFTATPASPLTANAAGNVTFAWTYTNMPSPAPTCTVDGGIGAVTSGASMSVTLPQARIFRLRCTNATGTAFLDATVPVIDCGVTSQCDPNATCAETAESYTCTCNNGYSGNGDTCGLVVADCTTTPAQCHADADCQGGTVCACKAGFFGSGAPSSNGCTRGRLTFVTSTTGATSGLLSSWAEAGGQTGLAAADAVCAARATAASLPGTYKAWMSDSTNDAYCRVHNLSGKKVNMCGAGSLPVAAGPWVRASLDRRPFSGAIDKLLAPNRIVYYAASFTEAGNDITTSTDRVWTGTDDNGVYTGNACSDWGSNSTTFQGTVGLVNGGGTSWTKMNTLATSDPLCSQTTGMHLRCMETNTGPALPPRHPTGVKRAFVTSVSGTGNLSTWADANLATGILAGDQICKARARYAGYTNAAAFKAFMSNSSSSYISGGNRITNSGFPYARPDGVLLGSSRADLIDGRFAGPWNQTETNAYLQGNADTGTVWTGTSSNGFYTSSHCSFWSQAQSFYSGTFGRYDVVTDQAMSFSTQTCDQTARLYCVED